MRLWSEKICEGSAKYNRPIPLQTQVKPWFEKAGFVDIMQHTFKSPSNTWPKNKSLKDISRYQLLAHFDGLEGVSLGLFTRALGWKEAELKVLLAKVRPELKDRTIHSYQPQQVSYLTTSDLEMLMCSSYVVYGRKPLAPPSPISPQMGNFPPASTVDPSMPSV